MNSDDHHPVDVQSSSRGGEWIAAQEALRLVRAATLSPYAPQQIAKRAYAGLIEAHAELLIAGQKEERDVSIPQEFWWANGEAALEQDWDLGDFSTWINRTLHVRAFGVSFRRTDLERMVPNAFGPRPVTAQSSPGRPLSKLWPDWVAELALYIHDTGIPDGRGSEGQDELIASIEARLSERGLSAPGRSTVQDAAKAVLLRMRQADNPP